MDVDEDSDPADSFLGGRPVRFDVGDKTLIINVIVETEEQGRVLVGMIAKKLNVASFVV